MATVIETLGVELKLLTGDFRAKSKAVADDLEKVRKSAGQTTKGFVEQGEKTAAAFSKIRNELLSLMAAFTAGKSIKDFFTSSLKSAQAVNILARDLGMSGAEVDKWIKTIDRAGGSGQGFVGMLKSIKDATNQIRTGRGDSPLTQELKGLTTANGESVAQRLRADSKGHIKQYEELMLIAEAFQKLSDADAQVRGQALGMDMATIQLFQQGPQAVEKLYKNTHSRAQAAIDAEEKLKEKMDNLGQAFQRSADILLTRLAPILEKVLNQLLKLAEWFERHPNVFAALAGSAAAFSAFIGGKWLLGILGALTNVTNGVGGLTTGFNLLGGAAAAAAKSVALVGAAYAGWKVGSAINDFIDKYETTWNIRDKIGDTIWDGLHAIGLADKRVEVDPTAPTIPGDPEARAKLAKYREEQAKLQAAAPAASTPAASDNVTQRDAQMPDARMTDSFMQNVRMAAVRVSDAVFIGARFVDDAAFGGRVMRSNLGSWPVAGGASGAPSRASTAPITSAEAGAYKPLLDMIGMSEGTDRGRGYDETLGYGKWTNGDQNLTGMTLDQIDALQTQMLQRQSAQGISASVRSSALGRYQIIQTTLRGLRKQMGLNGSELYDAAMQDRMAIALAKGAGLTQNGMASQWASLPRSDTGRSAYGQGTHATSAQVQAAIAQTRAALAPGAGMMASRGGGATNNDTDIQIGQITVQTAATDARGIARDIGNAIRNNRLVGQANTGMA